MFYDKDTPWYGYAYPIVGLGIGYIFGGWVFLLFFLLCVGAVIFTAPRKKTQ